MTGMKVKKKKASWTSWSPRCEEVRHLTPDREDLSPCNQTRLPELSDSRTFPTCHSPLIAYPFLRSKNLYERKGIHRVYPRDDAMWIVHTVIPLDDEWKRMRNGMGRINFTLSLSLSLSLSCSRFLPLSPPLPSSFQHPRSISMIGIWSLIHMLYPFTFSSSLEQIGIFNQIFLRDLFRSVEISRESDEPRESQQSRFPKSHLHRELSLASIHTEKKGLRGG